MVLFYSSNALGDASPVTIYAGKDKVENEDLIKYAWPQDVWVHVDKLSSPHIYLRLPPTMTWDSIPDALLADAAQLVKAGSIQGNKKDNITIIYTPASNLLKQGDMAIGSVSFKNDRLVKRFHVAERINAIVNRLNKTKKEVIVDHIAQQIERTKQEGIVKRAQANELKKRELEVIRQRKAESAARDYTNLYKSRGTASDEDEIYEASQKVDDFDPNEDFM